MPEKEPVAQVSKASKDAPENAMVSDDDFFAALHANLTGQPVVSSEAKEANTNADLANAFAQMENQQTQPAVVGNITDVTPPANNDLELDKDTIDVIKDKYGLVDKQDYSASSREAKRLNQELKQVEPYKELLGTIASDGHLQEMIFNYLQNGGQTPETTSEKLNLPEDFIFDGDEAFRNPNSDSAKVLNNLVQKSAEKIADQKLSTYMQTVEQKSAAKEQTQMRKEFMRENKVSDEEMESFEDWMKGTEMTMDMFYALYKGKDRDKKIATNAVKTKINRLKELSNKPMSLAGIGESGEEVKSAEDQLFDAILGKTLPMNSIFDK